MSDWWTEYSTMRTRHGILAAKEQLGELGPSGREHLEALRRQYGRSAISDWVLKIYADRRERVLEQRLLDKGEALLEMGIRISRG